MSFWALKVDLTEYSSWRRFNIHYLIHYLTFVFILRSIPIGTSHIQLRMEKDAEGHSPKLDNLPAGKIAVLNTLLGSHTGVWIVFPDTGFFAR